METVFHTHMIQRWQKEAEAAAEARKNTNTAEHSDDCVVCQHRGPKNCLEALKEELRKNPTSSFVAASRLYESESSVQDSERRRDQWADRKRYGE